MTTTTLNQTISGSFNPISIKAIVTRFMNWATAQEPNRFLWLAIALGIHGCVLAPIAIYLITATGTSLTLLFITTLAMSLTLISNLAALPTKYTIPVFFITALADIVVIAICIFSMMN